MNLFSMFDPSTSINFSFNWMTSIWVLFFLPSMYWLIPSRWNYFLILIIQILIKEFSLILNLKKNLFNILLLISLLMMIFMNNFLGMFPYVFVSTSHMVFGLSLSLSMWLSFMLYGWITNMNHMFIHLVPQGTPLVLIMFMVLIETISNFMRFGSLAVRLSANIIAGHLIMEMLSSMCVSGMPITLFVLLAQCVLTLFEFSVTFIQAYVFTILIILYSMEL
uniref:ATP synthase subunit a n=1 Tax=Wiebesia pumilae TaxID=150944 RepID=A0A8A3UU11_9HYME|nr:ATP synthase F0 subunit 6 [Wiebesia pumilae]